MRYAVIGTGAIGGFYGARLAKSGQEVHFLLHNDYEYVRAQGLQVDSCDGSFHLECKATPSDGPGAYIHNATAGMPQCDVVLVCLKTARNFLLKDLLPPLLRHDKKPLVVLIQNGIGVEADVQTMFPGVPLAAGLAFICSSKTEPGHISHQCYGRIHFGDYSCGDALLMQSLVDEFKAAGIRAGLVEYHEARWKKAVWNMPFNGMTVALNTQTDCLLKNPATRQLIHQQMMEVINAARHLGVNNIDESFADLMLTMTDEMTPYSPSMKLDFDFHRPMEIEYLYSRPIEIARNAGFPMPKLEMLEAELRFLEAK